TRSTRARRCVVSRANETFEMVAFNPPRHWKLLDVSSTENWECLPLIWIIEPIIALENLVLLVAETQTGKTLFALAMALAIATKQALFGRFDTLPVRTLYLALEDPVRRIKDRLCDMNAKTDPDAFQVYFAPGLNLSEESQLAWLEKFIATGKYELIFLDTY